MKSFVFSGALVLLAACGGGAANVTSPTSSAPSSSTDTLPDNQQLPETIESTLDGPTDDANDELTSPTVPSSTPKDNDTIVTADADFANLLNNMRARHGAAPVTHDALLDLAAQRHADDMLANGYFSHTGRNGSTLRERVDATGYEWRAIGENIGMGQQTEQEIMDGWTNSPGHHENNIRPVYEEFGLGYARNGRDTRWVLVLGDPR